ncbi:MAG: hypothetical protein GXY86_13160 [Firmicutes bacterium]|nr:hypothetical protein [Bacillota bacterium]
MIQRHSLILWANVVNEGFQESLNKAYNLLLALKEFGPELSPNYITAKRKKEAQKFDLSLETLQELLKKGINKEGDFVFSDLGYRISFFSSLKDDDSAGISITVGASNQSITNTFIVNLPLSLPIYTSPEVRNRLILTFKECVRVFNPYWACISNSVNIRRYDGYWGNKLPTTIHWVNYFGSQVSRAFGDAKIPTHTKEKFLSGYFILLKDEPINDEIEDDIKIQQKVNIHFGL